MAISLGSTPIDSVRLGSAQVDKIMLGDVEVWTNNPWPKTGTWAGGAIPAGSYYTATSFTAPTTGVYTVTWSFTITTTPSSGAFAMLGINSTPGLAAGDPRTGAGMCSVTYSGTFNAGDVIQFMCFHGSNAGTASGGSWSVDRVGDIPTPAAFGASSWLDFTDGLTDKGSAPQTWTGSATVSGGYLSTYGALRNPFSPSFDATSSPVSISLWAKPNGTSTSSINVAVFSGTNLRLGARIRPSDRTLWWDYRHGSTAQATTTAFTLGTDWTFLAAVIEPVSGTTWRARHYVNGVEKQNTTWGAGTQNVTTPYSLSANADSGTFNVLVDDFALYPAALSAAQITALYQAGRTT